MSLDFGAIKEHKNNINTNNIFITTVKVIYNILKNPLTVITDVIPPLALPFKKTRSYNFQNNRSAFFF